MPYSVFISHSSEDFDLVRAIQDAARPAGIEVYTYEQDLQPGSILSEKLLARVRSCDAMVVLLTESGAASPAVNQEIGAAKQAQKPVIPILEASVDPKSLALIQGTEYLPLDRANPAATMVNLSGRLAALKGQSDRSTWILLLVLAGLAIWASQRQ